MLWLVPIPLWVIGYGKMLRAKLTRGKDSQGFDTHTPTMKGVAYDLLWRVPIPLWVRVDGKLLRAKLVRGNGIIGFVTQTNKKETYIWLAMAVNQSHCER